MMKTAADHFANEGNRVVSVWDSAALGTVIENRPETFQAVVEWDDRTVSVAHYSEIDIPE